MERNPERILKAEDIADTIILVGDPGRVKQVSSHFDTLELEKSNREFLTHTGIYKGKRLTVLATGIGTDNIDIVLNELDALVNVDLEKRLVRKDQSSLRFIRLGTSGALHRKVQVGSTILSAIACGFDPLYHFYRDERGVTMPGITEAFMAHTGWSQNLAKPYFIESPGNLLRHFDNKGYIHAITISTPGFYGPQVRRIRLPPRDEMLLEKIGSFDYEGWHAGNFEMECSALYALSALMGHEAVTLCVAVANRISKKFLDDYQPAIDRLIGEVLEILVTNE